MLQVIFSIYFFFAFYKRAAALGKNPWAPCLLGGVSFIIASSLAGPIVAIITTVIGLSEVEVTATAAIATYGGLILSCFVFTKYLDKKYPKPPTDEPAAKLIAEQEGP
jgi:energy-converting hydrogenase Eha subunit A